MAYSIFTILNMLFRLLELAILVDCIASWIPQIQGNRFVEIIHDFIYPILEPLKRLQDKLIPGLPMDFSPIIALGLLNLFKTFIFGSIV